MKRFLAVFLVCLSLITISVDADAARRFGGGSSFGRSAPTFSQKTPAPSAAPQNQQKAASPTQQKQTATPNQATPQRPSMMRSVLTGLAAALGISALLSMLGINGAGLVSLITGILLALVVFMLIRWGMSKFMPRSVATSSGTYTNKQESTIEVPPMQREATQPLGSNARHGSVMDQFSGVSQSSGVQDITPDNFDREGFLQTAKTQYVKLQKAWDSGNVIEISDFTTQDVFVALTHQLRERGSQVYHSEIVELHNQLLGIAEADNMYVASVNFTGLIRVEDELEELNEIWILEKPIHGDGGWLLAGIQQNPIDSPD